MHLSIQNLCKQYDNGIKANDNISLEIEKGMFGLLGPNGAGKSSLMRTIATLQQPDSGQIWFNDIDVLANPDAIRKQLGYLPQEFGVYPKVTAYQMLHHIAVLKGLTSELKPWVDFLLQRVNLYEHRHKNVAEFSGGMKQRFGIAQALIGSPNLIIVDEPTAGLDPTERNRFHNILSEIAEDKIVILSTHIVQDVIELSTQMAIIHQGKSIYHGHPNEAMSLLAGKIYQKKIARADLVTYQQNFQIISERMIGGALYINIYSDQSPDSEWTPINPNLEDVFFYHTQAFSNQSPAA
ncbi:MAG: ABC transporter ATP-binding protein [Chitinophagales bacterium]|nr:ABC transporter ATP-binding protein [Chitinophagales bacterium]